MSGSHPHLSPSLPCRICACISVSLYLGISDGYPKRLAPSSAHATLTFVCLPLALRRPCDSDYLFIIFQSLNGATELELAREERCPIDLSPRGKWSRLIWPESVSATSRATVAAITLRRHSAFNDRPEKCSIAASQPSGPTGSGGFYALLW